MGTSFNQSQTTNNSKLPAMKKQAATGTMKTSAFLQRYNRSKNQNAQFWSDLTKLAEKAGKIESIDARRNPTNYNGPATGLDTRKRTPSRESVSHVRGQGGIHKAMNGVSQREVSGSEQHEHVLEGRSMNAILRPDTIPDRRAMTPRIKQSFSKASQDIGSSAKMSGYKAQDPAQCLKPSANFRKANEASLDRLWTKENEFGLHDS